MKAKIVFFFVFFFNIYVNSLPLLIEETTNQTESRQIKSNGVFFGERGKPEYPGENLSEQSRESSNSVLI